MNNDIYKYVQKTCKLIKCKEHIEDVCQTVMYILCQKDLINNELNKELENLIKGIVWNQSHKLFEKEKNYIYAYDIEYRDYEYEEHIHDTHKDLFDSYLPKLRRYVSENVYRINDQSLNQWKIWYMYYLGYTSKEIKQKLNITYSINPEIFDNINKKIKELIHCDFKKYNSKYHLLDPKDVKKPESVIVMLDRNYTVLAGYKNVNIASKDLNVCSTKIYQNLNGHTLWTNDKRFVYKTVYDAGDYIGEDQKPENIEKAIVMLNLNYNLIATYTSIMDASKETGINPTNIRYNLNSRTARTYDRIFMKKTVYDAGDYERHFKNYKKILKSDKPKKNPVPKINKFIRTEFNPLKIVVKLDLDFNVIATYNNARIASKETGYNYSSIYANLTNVTKRYKDNVFMYKHIFDSGDFDKDIRYGFEKARTLDKKIVMLDLSYNHIATYPNIYEASRVLDLTYNNIHANVTNETKRVKENIFMYKDKFDSGDYEKTVYKRYRLYENDKFIGQYLFLSEIMKITDLSLLVINKIIKGETIHKPIKNYTIKVIT